MTISQQLADFADLVAGRVVPFLTAMAAIGVLSMALIQTAKDLLPIRRWFQRRYLRQWLHTKTRDVQEAIDPARAERDLIRLATAGDESAFYDLAIEQLCGQMSAATTVVLDFPARHRDLLTCLAAEADPDDRAALLRAAELGRAALERMRSDAPGDYQILVDARSRVTHQVQRSVDALQIAAGFRWKLTLQIAAFATSYVLTVVGLSLYRPPGTSVLTSAIVSVPLGLIAGFLAPIARDIVAIVSRARKA
jgi:hypothetical protein